MNIDLEKYTFYIRPGYTDMRKGARSLAYLVQNEMKLNIYSRSVFLFSGASKRIVKALLWERNGWLELAKKIETKDRFCWPKDEKEAMEVSLEAVKAMLNGNDPWVHFEPLFPSCL